MDESKLQLISGIGSKLGQLGRPNKDVLVKSLRQVANALSQIEQPSVVVATKAQALKKLEAATKPLRKSIVKHDLFNHTDKDVKLLVAICVTEFFRILAPQPPFADNYLRDIFKLIVSIFMELADTTSTFFSRRVKILETVAQCKCCVIMLDIDCNDLILEMFKVFFSVVRDHHQPSLINDVLSIMTHILNEEVSDQLIDLILRNLIQESKDATSVASQLAASVIQSCAQKIQPFVCGFLTSCSLDRDAVQSELKEFYHEIVLKMFQCAPEMLNAVIPHLTQELMTDQVDVRIKAVNLIGKLLLQPECHLAQRYRALFVEFLKRFSDKSSEVRINALQCAKACCLANPSGTESHELLTAIEDRLLDFDDKVRMQAVIVACDLAASNLKYTSPKLISEVIERLRDKKISVRKKALQKVMEVYRDYCTKCEKGHITMCDHFEQIPCKVLMLCYDKDCKEFRSQNIELIFAEDLFPVLLPVEERARHWIHFFSLFSPFHLKALSAILSQKRRLQTEMRNYLVIQSKGKGNSLEDMLKKLRGSFVKMSASFPDPSKAEECLEKLSQTDNGIFNKLRELLDEVTLENAMPKRDKFLKEIGNKHQYFEFLQLLSSKCLFNIFDSEFVCCILNLIASSGLGSNHLEPFSVELLLVIISNFPSLMKGWELQFQTLFEKKYLIHDKIIQVLAKAGPHISVKFSDFYPVLKKICLEGTRNQSKHAVSAIASLVDVSNKYVLSELCEELVDSLHSGQNIATVLQSLGCISQYSVSTFEDHDREITHVCKKNFLAKSLEDPSVIEDSSGCTTCKLKIYGLKMLVKSFLPHQGSQVNREIKPLLSILLKMLRKDDMCDDITSCTRDKAYFRLAAAKSVLLLSRRWDLHISPNIFLLTILIAKDSSSFVRRSFLDKTHKLLKERVIPIKFACAFTLVTSDCPKDLQHDSFKYMAEFIKEYSREARIRQTSMVQGGSIMDYPAYIVVFLIHLLVHDAGFPSEDCQDETVYAQFCRPLLSFIHTSINSSVVDGDLNLIKDAAFCLNYIFRAIKRAKDAVDDQRTPMLHFLADIGISGINSLHKNGISCSHTPGMILLPSSLYKITPTESKEANLKFLNQSFVERVVDIFKSQVCPPVRSVHKRGRKCLEEGALNTVLHKQVDYSSCGALDMHKKLTRQDISLEHRQRRAVSPNALEPDGSCDNGFNEEQEYGASFSSKAALEKEQPFSFSGSVTQRPSQTGSQALTQKVESKNAFKRNVGAGKNSTTEASNDCKGKINIPCSSKELANKNDVLLGQRIQVWSTSDSCFYSGTVDDFNPENNSHKITRDSGEVEIICLDSESWETISDCSLTEREVVLSDKSNTFDLKERAKDTVAKFRDDANQQSKAKLNMEDVKLPSRKIAMCGKKKKELGLSRDSSSVSEIVNIDEDVVARRTRRRKVFS